MMSAAVIDSIHQQGPLVPEIRTQRISDDGLRLPGAASELMHDPDTGQCRNIEVVTHQTSWHQTARPITTMISGR